MAGYIYNLEVFGELNNSYKDDFFNDKHNKELLFEELHKNKRFFDNYVIIHHLNDVSEKEQINRWIKISYSGLMDLIEFLDYSYKETKTYKNYIINKKYLTERPYNENNINYMRWNYDFSIPVFTENNNILHLGIKNNKIIELYQDWNELEFVDDTVEEHARIKYSYEIEKIYNNFQNYVDFGIILKKYEYTNTSYILDLEEPVIENIKIILNNEIIEFKKLDKEKIELYINNNLIYNEKIIQEMKNIIKNKEKILFNTIKLFNNLKLFENKYENYLLNIENNLEKRK